MNKSLAMSKPKSTRIYHGVGLLALSSFVAKIIGAIYRIPLTNILGVEGIGQYQLVFPLYALLLAVVCSGTAIVISQVVAYDKSLGRSDTINSFIKSCTIVLIISSVVATIFCYAIANTLSTIQQNINLNICYYAIAPAIIFVSISNVIKGWFIGQSNMLPNSVCNLLEQVLKLIFGLSLAKALMQYGLIYAVVGALVSITIVEFIECIILAIWIYSKNRKTPKLPLDFKQNATRFLKSSFPITLSSLVFPLIAFFDSIIIVRLLLYKGMSMQNATSLYGILTGPIGSLIHLPVVISLALSIAIVPKVSSYLAHLEVEHIKSKTALCIQASFMICLPSFLGIFVLARPILSSLYPTMSASHLSQAVFLLQVQSVSVVFLSQLEIFNSVLQSLEKSTAVWANVSIGGVLKLIIEIVLIPYIGIVGACIGSIVFFGTTWLLNLRLYKNLVGKNVILFQNVSKILLSGVIMTMAVLGCTIFLNNKYAMLVIGILVGMCVYFALLVGLKVVDKSTLEYLPFIKKIRKDKTND